MATASAYRLMSGSFALQSADPTNWTPVPTTQSLAGTSAADLMRDVAGGVALNGGQGDDSYYVGDYRSTILEASGQGHDTVYAFVNYTAEANIENITLLATGRTATGNALSNLITTKVGGTTLNGGAGDDALVDLSSGQTTFAFTPGSGKDVIYGFTAGSGGASDLIRLEGFGLSSFSQLQGKISASGSDTLINLNGSDQILIKGVAPGALAASDFSFAQMQSGVYVGNNPADLTTYENWLGDNADIIGLHTGKVSWADWQGSLDWLIGRFKDVPATHAWTLPLFVEGGNLTDGAAGKYDSYYVKAAQSLAAAQPTGDILVRTGVEFNGDWMPWKAQGQEAAFAETFRNFVDAFRSVSPRFKFEWNMNVGTWNVDVEKAYPGDAYVDFIGMDFYYDTKWYPADPAAAWNQMLNQNYGLKWFEAFAAQHNKPTAYSEWGVNSDTAGSYIQQVYDWFASHNVAYQMYWESDAAFAGRMDSGQYPNAAAVYKALFDGDPASTGYALDPSLVPSAPTTAPAPAEPAPVGPVSTLIGTGADNLLKGGAGFDSINGGAGKDTLEGGAGADTLDGGAGNDTLKGGPDDDVYYLDSTSDKVIENAGEGVDTVYIGSTYTLGANVENLVFLWNGSCWGYGNSLDNAITGNSGKNYLEGKDGADTLSGGAGADTLVGGAGADVLIGGADGDVFKFERGGGQDVVRDFGAGDLLQVSALGGPSKAALTYDGANTKIAFTTGESIDLVGVKLADLHMTSDGFVL